MKMVKAFFEAELPFWLCMSDGDYDILIDGKPCKATGTPWKIDLSNDKWLVEMGNSLDGHQELVSIATTDVAKNYDDILPKQPYYHKRKLRTVLKMRWGWEIKDDATANDAKEKLNQEWNWCTNSFLKSVNRFIDIYRTSNIPDKVPTSLDTYDLSFNWWYTLFLEDEVIERIRLGLDAYPVIRKPPIKVDKKIQETIAKKLSSDYSPPPWLLIVENAFAFHRRGKYRMAVTEMYAGFEIFMMEFIGRKYTEKKYESLLIDYLMNRNELNHMLNHGLRLAIGKSFSEIDNVLWSKWDNQKDGARKLRHDIIHNGQLIVSKEESGNVINVINQMIQILNKFK